MSGSMNSEDGKLQLRPSRASVRDRGKPGVTGAHAVAGAEGLLLGLLEAICLGLATSIGDKTAWKRLHYHQRCCPIKLSKRRCHSSSSLSSPLSASSRDRSSPLSAHSSDSQVFQGWRS